MWQRSNQVKRRVSSWMGRHDLDLATEKTEIVVLTRRRILTNVQLLVGSQILSTCGAVKYLEIRLDTKLSFWNQIQTPFGKAVKTTVLLSKKGVLMSVASILLCDCKIYKLGKANF